MLPLIETWTLFVMCVPHQSVLNWDGIIYITRTMVKQLLHPSSAISCSLRTRLRSNQVRHPIQQHLNHKHHPWNLFSASSAPPHFSSYIPSNPSCSIILVVTWLLARSVRHQRTHILSLDSRLKRHKCVARWSTFTWNTRYVCHLVFVLARGFIDNKWWFAKSN